MALTLWRVSLASWSMIACHSHIVRNVFSVDLGLKSSPQKSFLRHISCISHLLTCVPHSCEKLEIIILLGNTLLWLWTKSRVQWLSWIKQWSYLDILNTCNQCMSSLIKLYYIIQYCHLQRHVPFVCKNSDRLCVLKMKKQEKYCCAGKQKYKTLLRIENLAFKKWSKKTHMYDQKYLVLIMD